MLIVKRTILRALRNVLRIPQPTVTPEQARDIARQHAATERPMLWQEDAVHVREKLRGYSVWTIAGRGPPPIRIDLEGNVLGPWPGEGPFR